MDSIYGLCGRLAASGTDTPDSLYNQCSIFSQNTSLSSCGENNEAPGFVDSVLSCHKTSGTTMSMKEYKLYIYDQISMLSLNSSRNNSSLFVDISDAGFEAMKSDPVYEAWVLDTIRRNFAAPDSPSCDTYMFLSFGAKKSEFRQESWSLPNRQELERMRKSFWEKKEARRRKMKRLQEKKRQEEKWQREACQKAYWQLSRLDHLHQLQEENKALRFGRDFSREDRSASLMAAARRKSTAYESTFLFTGIGLK